MEPTSLIGSFVLPKIDAVCNTLWLQLEHLWRFCFFKEHPLTFLLLQCNNTQENGKYMPMSAFMLSIPLISPSAILYFLQLINRHLIHYHSHLETRQKRICLGNIHICLHLAYKYCPESFRYFKFFLLHSCPPLDIVRTILIMDHGNSNEIFISLEAHNFMCDATVLAWY